LIMGYATAPNGCNGAVQPSLAYSIRVVVDAMLRRRILNSGSSAEVVNSLLRDAELGRRRSALRWGIVLVALAVGFAAIEWLGWREFTPGLIAVLAGVTGLGNLLFFFLSRRL
jgi:hypothetical protein